MLLHGVDLHPGVATLAIALGYHGYRKGSLSASGGLAAAAVGYAHLANPHPAFGLLLLSFYFTGSRATKVKAQRKAQLEYEGGGHKSSSGGRRNASQVLCNSLLPALAALAYRFLLSAEPAFDTIRVGMPLSWLQDGSDRASLLAASLLCLATGHYACCMGDTLASELGILSTSPPRLVIHPSRTVPPGTNGGMSAWGTLCSALGGTAMGVVLFLAELTRARPGWGRGLALVGLSTLAGLGGSLLDSLLGATLQRTWFRPTASGGQVLLGRPEKQEEWQVITGYDVLSNNAVNLVSSALTAGGFLLLARACL